jgi:hypothetical protein
MSDPGPTEIPDDGGERPSGPRRRHDVPDDEIAAPDEAVGDFGDGEHADRGGDSDVER